MAAARRCGVESGKPAYPSGFGHVLTCDYMSHKSNESFVPKQLVYCWRKVSDKNLEQRINIKFCVKIGKSASEALALLTVTYDEYTVEKLSVPEWHRWSKTSTHFSFPVREHACVFLRSQGDCSLWINCTRTNGEFTVLFVSANKDTGIPGSEIHYRTEPSALFTCFSPLRFLALSKIKKCPGVTTIYRHSWHPIQRDFTARYFGKRFSRLFPAVAPSSHEVHSFTRRVFRRRQQPLVQRQANLLSQGHSRN
jgi:hypothetical protein